jgi:hypothetical protein
MRNAKGKTPGRAGTSGGTAARKEVDLDALREKIARHVSRKGLAMVKTTTEEVVKVGNLAALKYLFELIGVYPGGGATASEDADSDDLTRTLLNRLDLRKREERESEIPELPTGPEKDSVE